MGDTNYCFWKLLKEKVIQIPIIQRDYAQGRDTPQVNRIRGEFLHVLFDCLTEASPLHLDFVYGSIKDGNFIPLDGQQRLTTLFLLHWYLAWKDNLLEKNVSEILLKFSYETRVFSHDFCSKLVSKFNAPFVKNAEFVSDIIKNSEWYFLAWNRDPTIKAMLKTLDDIHLLFRGAPYNLFGLLIDEENPLITFEFHELENFKLGDELYIKMNARGKELTDFEIFKSRLQQHIDNLVIKEELSAKNKTDFMKKIDIEWTDYFWDIIKNTDSETRPQESGEKKDTPAVRTDRAFLYFLLVTFDNYSFAFKERKNEEFQDINNTDGTFREFMDCISGKCILEIEKLLDIFSGKDFQNQMKYQLSVPVAEMIPRDIVKNAVNPECNLEFTDRVKYFAYAVFLTENPEFEESQLRDWMRVMRNLAENTIYNLPSDCINSMKSVFKLVKQSKNIVNYIADNGKIFDFNKEQIEEERKKAALILSSKNWKKAIEDAEEHPYFAGQIGFLLDFSGTELSSFIEYYKKASLVFNEKGIANYGGLWRRALLCFGDYTLTSGSNTSFLTDTKDRDISWKRLLRGDGERKEKREYIKLLLNRIDIEDIENSLLSVINLDGSSITDWRRYFISCPKIIEKEVCGADLLFRFSGEKNILLLKTTKTSGYCREYYSFALYCDLKRDYPDCVKEEYTYSAGFDNPKFFSLSKQNSKNVQSDIFIGFDRNESKWVCSTSQYFDKDTEFYEDREKLLDYLKTGEYIR